MFKDNYFKSTVCFNSFNSCCFFEIYIFSATTDFFSSPPKCRFPQTRSNSLIDRILHDIYQCSQEPIIGSWASDKVEGVFTKNVLGLLTVYAHR